MIDILPTIERWCASGLRVAIATVVDVAGSAPRLPGSALAVNERGEVVGSVSGGCVEGAVYEETMLLLGGGRPRLVRYGISDDDALSVGLTCGGEIGIFVDLVDARICARLARALAERDPIALVTRLDDDLSGSKVLLTEGDVGDLDARAFDDAIVTDARALLAAGETALRSYERSTTAGAAHVFVHAFVPQADMYIFGAVDFSRAMARAGKFLDFRVSVIDARPIFATKERMPDADEVVVAWPDEFLRNARVDARTAIVVLTHDLKFDIPLLEVALETTAGYIGAMGSRRTHERRMVVLRELGLSEGSLARISGPIGLDIGAQTPEETAVSIAAEIVALRAGRTGGRLSSGSQPIHPVTSSVALRVADCVDIEA